MPERSARDQRRPEQCKMLRQQIEYAVTKHSNLALMSSFDLSQFGGQPPSVQPYHVRYTIPLPSSIGLGSSLHLGNETRQPISLQSSARVRSSASSFIGFWVCIMRLVIHFISDANDFTAIFSADEEFTASLDGLWVYIMQL